MLLKNFESTVYLHYLLRDSKKLMQIIIALNFIKIDLFLSVVETYDLVHLSNYIDSYY